ncbi:MAG: hypothetical protein AAF196_11700 [Planctomycetota bacterium]
MDNRDFYAETKWCDECQDYKHYLMSVNRSYCVDCGGQVRLFSREEAEAFAEEVQRKKFKAV